MEKENYSFQLHLTRFWDLCSKCVSTSSFACCRTRTVDILGKGINFDEFLGIWKVFFRCVFYLFFYLDTVERGVKVVVLKK